MTFFKKSGDGYAALYSENAERLVAWEEAEGLRHTIREIRAPESIDPNLHNLSIGDIQICRYNWNPFQQRVILEDWEYLWSTGILSDEAVTENISKFEILAVATIGEVRNDDGVAMSSFSTHLLSLESGETQRGGTPEFQRLFRELDTYRETGMTEKSLRQLCLAIRLYCRAIIGVPERIEIALCSNATLLPHIPVQAYSLLVNTASPIRFNIVLSEVEPPEFRASMDTVVHGFPGSAYRILYIDSDRLELKTDNRHESHWGYISRDTYTRLFLPSILADLHRVIYLDIDILAVGDIRRLWETQLTMCSIIGMAREPDNQYYWDSRPDHYQAGVILMDLTRMRLADFENRISSRYAREAALSEYIDENDQGLLNREFEKEITKLPVRFNISQVCLPGISLDTIHNEKQLLRKFGPAFYEDAVLYHYAGPTKAWDILGSRYFQYKNQMRKAHAVL